MNSIAFFNNKGGVGKTTLVYHLAWALARTGKKVLALDLDPQANLSSMCLPEERIEELKEQNYPNIYSSIAPLLKGTKDLDQPEVLEIQAAFDLVLGDLRLSSLEDSLSRAWGEAFQGKQRAFPLFSAFFRIMLHLHEQNSYDFVLVDLGPNLGAINRAALLSAEYMINPLAPDLYSLQGLENLGLSLGEWNERWHKILTESQGTIEVPLPQAAIKTLGYIVMQHSAYKEGRSYQYWIERIPGAFQQHILHSPETPLSHNNYCLAKLKHYHSLMAMAQEARKPAFHLTNADGAIGSHQQAVQDCYDDFRNLASRIIQQIEQS